MKTPEEAKLQNLPWRDFESAGHYNQMNWHREDGDADSINTG